MADLHEAALNLTYALEDLLSVAERIRGGDPKLNPEEWYASRDYARVTLDKWAVRDVRPVREGE